MAAVARYGQSNVVLFIGYGEWDLDGENDRACENDFCIHYTLRLLRMVTYAVWIKNAPQIYKRLIDNALYGYLKSASDPSVISSNTDKIATKSL